MSNLGQIHIRHSQYTQLDTFLEHLFCFLSLSLLSFSSSSVSLCRLISVTTELVCTGWKRRKEERREGEKYHFYPHYCEKKMVKQEKRMGVRKGSLCPVVVCARMRQKLQVFLFLSVHTKITSHRSSLREGKRARSLVWKKYVRRRRNRKWAREREREQEKETEIHAHMRGKKRVHIELSCSVTRASMRVRSVVLVSDKKKCTESAGWMTTGVCLFHFTWAGGVKCRTHTGRCSSAITLHTFKCVVWTWFVSRWRRKRVNYSLRWRGDFVFQWIHEVSSEMYSCLW